MQYASDYHEASGDYSTKWNSMDGLHYDYYTSKAIYEFMVEQVTNP